MRTIALTMLVMFGCAVGDALAQRRPRQVTPSRRAASEALAAKIPDAKRLDPTSVAARTAAILLERQEGKTKSEWPYEGVYRERGSIPIGYRVGGTAICALALATSPKAARVDGVDAALQRAIRFILEALDHSSMSASFKGSYDVRGWGHAYALMFFLTLERTGRTPKPLRGPVAEACKTLVRTLASTAIEESGGWNYARRFGGRDRRNQASPFMTAPTLQALFLASSMGYAVPSDTVTRALAALERSRTPSGGVTYSIPDVPVATDDEQLSMMHKRPGAIARMACVETTLLLAGRSDQKRLVAAIDAFFDHWVELDARRKEHGTHIGPYGVAPYYDLFGHFYVAQAIEYVTDDAKKKSYRDRLNRTLAVMREPNGGWNDRVFDRSECYGTAMAAMALRMAEMPRVPAWKAPIRER